MAKEEWNHRLENRLRHLFKSLSILGFILIPVFIILTILIIWGIIVGIQKLFDTPPKDLCIENRCFDDPFQLACHPPSNFSADCIGPTQIEFSNHLQQVFLGRINHYRNAYSGNLMSRSYYNYAPNRQKGGYADHRKYKPTDRPPCGRCGIIQWDKDLARLAVSATKYCITGRDYCCKRERFPHCGMLEVMAEARRYEYWLQEVVKRWTYVESRFEVSNEYFIVTHEKQTHVGCGMATMNITKSKVPHIYLVCFFSFDEDKTTYTVDGPNFIDRGGSRCKTGVDLQYENLCSLDEDIQPLEARVQSFVNLNDSQVPLGAKYKEQPP